MQLFFGMSTLITKHFLVYIDPFIFAFLKLSVGFAYSVLYYKPHVHVLLQTYKVHYKKMLFIVFVGICPKYLLKYWSMQHLSVAHITCVYHTTPAVTVLISYILYGKNVCFRQGVGVIVSFLGIVLCTVCNCNLGVISYPLICLFGAVIAHSMSMLWVQEMVHSSVPLSELLVITLFLSAVLSGLIAAIGSGAIQCYSVPSNWIFCCILGFMGFKAVVYHYYHYWALGSYSAVWISLIEYLGPLIGCGYGYWVMGDIITGQQIMGLVITGIGMYIFYCGDQQKQYSFS